MSERIKTEVYSDGEDTVRVTRRTRAQHARQAEVTLAVVEEMGEIFTEEFTEIDDAENTLRLRLLDVTVARAQVHATLATAASEFNLSPDAEEEAPDNAVQLDVDDVDHGDTERPGQFL